MLHTPFSMGSLNPGIARLETQNLRHRRRGVIPAATSSPLVNAGPTQHFPTAPASPYTVYVFTESQTEVVLGGGTG